MPKPKYTVEPKNPIPSTIIPKPKTTDWYAVTILAIGGIGYSVILFLGGILVGQGF